MTRILELYFGTADGADATRSAFEIGMGRLMDPQPILTREVLADPDFLVERVGDDANDWRQTGDDLEAAIDQHRDDT
ncbi:MAG TPA: hypothetical protein VG916_04095 [Gemmatimonadaceae bacterium]|nr:hypothetical protein [Gemmatimonadaceae bacterium]